MVIPIFVLFLKVLIKAIIRNYFYHLNSFSIIILAFSVILFISFVVHLILLIVLIKLIMLTVFLTVVFV